MIVELRLMRNCGRRLPWREIDNGPAYIGKLQTVCSVGSARPITARLLTVDAQCRHIVPDLHEPMIIGFGIDTFRLRGIERVELDDGIYGVVQEWQCKPVKDKL